MAAPAITTETTETDTRPTCVIYVRISKDEQTGTDDEGLGVGRQEKACRGLADRLGLRVTRVYVENDTGAWEGGRKGGLRPVYVGMLEDLDQPDASRHVLAKQHDRLSRNTRETGEWLDWAGPRGILVHLSNTAGPIDAALSGDRLHAQIFSAIAEHESAIKSERIRDKTAQQRAAGRYIPGRTPLGYKRGEGKTLILDEPVAAVIAKSTLDALAGRSFYAIAKDWDAAGIPRPRSAAGRAWRGQVVLAILKRWGNAGLTSYRDEPIGPSEWPALPGVEREHIEALRAMHVQRSHDNSPGKIKYLLSGIARCWCGGPMRKGSRHYFTDDGQRHKAPRYICYHTLGGRGHAVRDARAVEEYVLDWVANGLRTDESEELGRLLGPSDESAAIAQLHVEDGVLNDRLTELGDMFTDGEIDRKGHHRQTERVKARLAVIAARLAALHRRSAVADLRGAPDPGQVFLDADLETQRLMLRALVDIAFVQGVTRRGRQPFNPDSVSITWRVPPED